MSDFKPWSSKSVNIADVNECEVTDDGIAMTKPNENGFSASVPYEKANISNGDVSKFQSGSYCCGYTREELSEALGVQVGGDHYKTKSIQPVEYCMANNIGFMEGSVIKYVTRWRDKGGVEDLKKARHFLDMLIEAQ